MLSTEKTSVKLGLRTVKCPWWQLERRGHFRRHSLKVTYFLCTLCSLQELPGFTLEAEPLGIFSCSKSQYGC